MSQSKQQIVTAIAATIPETPEEGEDQKATIIYIKPVGFGTQLDATLNIELCGRYPVRRAAKIAQKLNEHGHRNFYLRCI